MRFVPSSRGMAASFGEDEAGAHHGMARKRKLEAGVKMRSRKRALRSVGGRTNVVSERFISFAIACISSLESPSASGKMASGFPVKGRSVKTSAWKNRYSFIRYSPRSSLGSRAFESAILVKARIRLKPRPRARAAGLRGARESPEGTRRPRKRRPALRSRSRRRRSGHK